MHPVRDVFKKINNHIKKFSLYFCLVSINLISEKRKRGEQKAFHFSVKPLPQVFGLLGVLA